MIDIKSKEVFSKSEIVDCVRLRELIVEIIDLLK